MSTPTQRDLEQARFFVDRWVAYHKDIDGRSALSKEDQEDYEDLERRVAVALAARDAEWRERVETAERQRRVACGVADELGNRLRTFKEKCKAFLDESGEPRKVLGDIQITNDGAIVMPSGRVYAVILHPAGWKAGTPERTCVAELLLWGKWGDNFGQSVAVVSSWSTEDAAIAEQTRLDTERDAAIAAAEAARKEGV